MAESYSVTAYLKAHDTNFSKEFEKAQKTVGKFKTGVSNTMAKIGPIVAKATKATGVALVAFGAYGIKSAADLRVVEAQYGQAFEGVSKEADTMVSTMSKSFNMLPERLKAPMSSFQSYFKGTGMEVDKSLQSTEKAMTLAADSSAYYDKSIEDTSASLKGFLLGNFENGDAIGINTNLTKIGQKYNEKYGGSFDDLSEAQKQNYLLEYVEDIYALNGVMGQSERESKSFENVFSNLKSSISTFAAKVMEPFMDPLIDAMQRAGEWMSTADEKFFAFVETIKNSTAFQTLSEVVQMAIDKVKEFGQSDVWATIVTSFQDLGQAILDIDFVKLVEDVGAFLEKWAPLIGAIAGGIGAFKVITGTINGVKTAIDLAKTSIGLLSGALTFFTSPIGLAVLAIGILIGIGILLYQNWDTIKAKLGELKDKFISDWNELKDVVGGAMTTLKDSAIADFEELKTMGSTAVATLKDAAIADFNELKTGGSNAFETLKSAAVSDTTELKTGAGNMIRTLKTAAISDFNQLKTGGSNAIKTLRNAGVSDFNQLKSIASNAVSNLKTAVVNGFNTMVSSAASKARELPAKVGSAFSDAVSRARGFAEDAVGVGRNLIAGFVRGVVSKATDLANSVGNAISGAINKAKGMLGIHSPSKLFTQFGEYTDQGFINGIDAYAGKAKKAMGNMINGATSVFDPTALQFSTSGIDIASSVAKTYGNINQTVDHVVNDNLNNGKQPLNLNVQLGNRAYKLFVDDISNTQNAQAQLVETYL